MVDKRLEKLILKKHEEILENAVISYINKNNNDTYSIEKFYSNGLYLGDDFDLDFYGYIRLLAKLKMSFFLLQNMVFYNKGSEVNEL